MVGYLSVVVGGLMHLKELKSIEESVRMDRKMRMGLGSIDWTLRLIEVIYKLLEKHKDSSLRDGIDKECQKSLDFWGKFGVRS